MVKMEVIWSLLTLQKAKDPCKTKGIQKVTVLAPPVWQRKNGQNVTVQGLLVGSVMQGPDGTSHKVEFQSQLAGYGSIAAVLVRPKTRLLRAPSQAAFKRWIRGSRSSEKRKFGRLKSCHFPDRRNDSFWAVQNHDFAAAQSLEFIVWTQLVKELSKVSLSDVPKPQQLTHTTPHDRPENTNLRSRPCRE